MHALRDNFLGADFRPVGLTAGSRALVRVVDDLEWLADRVGDDAGAALWDMKDPAVRVLRGCAAVLRITRVEDRADSRAELDAALADLREVARGRYREDLVAILDAPNDDTAVLLGRELLSRRTIAATVGATGADHRRRGGRRRPAGVGAGAGTAAASDRRIRPAAAGNRCRGADYVRVLGQPFGGGA